MTVIHEDDQTVVEKLHSNYVNKLNDDLLSFQDESYSVGRARGLKEGDQQREELIALLDRVRLNVPQLQGVPGLLSDIEAAIAKAKGGAK